MTCPRCGSLNHDRYRSPASREGITLRRHRCRECGLVFLSAQLAIDDLMLAERLLEAFDPSEPSDP